MPKTNSDVNVVITFRHTEPTEAIKKYVTEKIIQCASKYSSNHVDVKVVLSVTKLDHSVEAHLHSNKFDVTAKAVTQDLYSAIDKVVDNIDVQLRKQKERISQHKQADSAV